MLCDRPVTLTVEQIVHVRGVADKWVQAGLSTRRCDRPRAEASVRFAYRSAGLDEPQHIVWMDSPPVECSPRQSSRARLRLRRSRITCGR